MSLRARAAAVLATAVLGLVAGQVLSVADAQVVPIVPTSTTTTAGGGATTTAPPATTTTTSPAPILPAPESSTTTAPPTSRSTTTTTTTTAPRPLPLPTPGTEPPPPSTAPGAPGPDDGDGTDVVDGTAPPPGAGSPLIPPEAQAIINSVQRTGPNNTRALLEALRALEDFGLTPLEAQIIGMGRFPVAGYASYVHDWLYPRWGPGLRFHRGTDIFAAYGTPVRSPATGFVSRISDGGLGGLSVYVTQPEDGTYFYMTHLSGIPEGLVVGQEVEMGDIVGFVGDSGNARGTPPHLHFQIHPQGGDPIDPKPILDRWIAEATANVPALVNYFQARQPRALVATGLVRHLSDDSLANPSVEQASGPSRTQLLWASSANPAGGALHLAEAEADRAAGGVDWEQRAVEEQQRVAVWQAATTRADELLAPLSVPAVAAALASLGASS